MNPPLLCATPRLAGAAASLLLGACASWLPSAHTDSSTFADFEAARSAVEGLLPASGALAVADLDASPSATLPGTGGVSLPVGAVSALGPSAFDPQHLPNATVLTQADVVRMFFIPNTVLTRADLDPGVLACVQARGACHGIALKMDRIDKVRTGNFFADLAQIHRRTETTGWRFNAVILYVGSQVVYRAWGGQPDVHEFEEAHNPLGPLQDMSPSGLLKP